MMTPAEIAAKLAALLNSRAGCDAGFEQAEVLEDVQGAVIGVTVGGDDAFIEVQPA